MPNVITYKQLREAGACEDKRRLFKTLFGESVVVTVELAESVASEFDWQWAANNLLSSSAREAYNAARASAREAYEAATASAREAYEAATARAFALAYLSDEKGN